MTATPQSRAALDLANRIRLGNATLKREVAAGDLPVVAAVDDDRAAAIRIGALLLAQPRWGARRTSQVLMGLGIHEHRRVRDLTARQRRALVEHLNSPTPTRTPAGASKPARRRAPAPAAVTPSGMEPERVDARVVAALVVGPVTRTELALRLREMCLAVDDLDASLPRLMRRGAVVIRKGDGYRLYSVGARWPDTGQIS